MQFSFEGLECETSTIIILGGKERRGFSVTLWERLGAPIRGYSGEWEGVWRADRRRGRGIFCPVTGAAKCQTPHAAEEERRPLKDWFSLSVYAAAAAAHAIEIRSFLW